MKRKLVSLLCLLALVFGLLPAVSAAPATPTVFLDGKQLEFEVPPTIIDGSTLVPLRKIFEEQGAEVSWEDSTQTVTAVRGDIHIAYKIGASAATKNNDSISLSVPGQVIGGSTLVPLRFVSEALGATVGWEGLSRTITISSAAKKSIKVDRVVDGDTVEVNWDGKTEKIRLIGMDTPESVHPDANRNTEEGKTTSVYTKEQLEGKTVLVEIDVEERDKHGRLLGYLYLGDGTFYNAKLVAEGYAKVATFPPNVRWVELFKHLQTDARDAGRGLWDGQPAPSPAATESPDAPVSTPAPTDDANINYKNCTEAKAAGAAPLHTGDPGYRPALDRDGDGVACEK